MGFILLDKPAGITSHDAVRKVRQIFGIKKVGHAGTLDPFATGLLIVLLGPATRLAEYLLDLPKTYGAEITLGATSDTDDVTGKIFSTKVSDIPTENQINQILKTFTGLTQQIPPTYAATKIKGQRAYHYARRGESVPQKPRPIKIYDIKLLGYQYPKLKLRVTCGRGTYIRALARDIGAALKTGGYCSNLRRLAIGKFAVKDAYKMTDLPTKLSTAPLADKLLVDHLPKIILSPDNVAKFKQGKAVEVASALIPNTTYAILDTATQLIGLGRTDPNTTLLHPHKVLV